MRQGALGAFELTDPRRRGALSSGSQHGCSSPAVLTQSPQGQRRGVSVNLPSWWEPLQGAERRPL